MVGVLVVEMLVLVLAGGGTERGVVGARARGLEDRRGRARARVRLISHKAAALHLHAVEAYVGGRGWARVADVARLRSCNARQRGPGSRGADALVRGVRRGSGCLCFRIVNRGVFFV